MHRSGLQAKAMVMCSKGLNPVLVQTNVKYQTTFFQQPDIRFTVGHQFFLELRDDLLLAPLLVPLFELLAPLRGQGFDHVVVDGWGIAHVRLVFGGVELVRKVPLFEFGDPEGFRKSREGHLEETQGINKKDLVVDDV